MKLYPLIFDPIFKERIWGGRNLETLYGKSLPPTALIGESWEISDRPGDESIIRNGPLRGKSIHWLMEQCPTELLGQRDKMPPRFPLLIKILDARQTLSLQVHPPAGVAEQFGGEPKTEFWYVAQAGPEAELFVGLKRGVTRDVFKQKLAEQTVAECFHTILPKAGDAMFLPSGRVHALGRELVIFEVQQNSDTTYRVFDWNRVDSSGIGRQLHVEQSLASIDFDDFEPGLLPRTTVAEGRGTFRPLVQNDLFEVAVRTLPGGELVNLTEERMQIIGVAGGVLRIESAEETVFLHAGQFCLVPAQSSRTVASAERASSFLEIC